MGRIETEDTLGDAELIGDDTGPRGQLPVLARALAGAQKLVR